MHTSNLFSQATEPPRRVLMVTTALALSAAAIAILFAIDVRRGSVDILLALLMPVMAATIVGLLRGSRTAARFTRGFAGVTIVYVACVGVVMFLARFLPSDQDLSDPTNRPATVTNSPSWLAIAAVVLIPTAVGIAVLKLLSHPTSKAFFASAGRSARTAAARNPVDNPAQPNLP